MPIYRYHTCLNTWSRAPLYSAPFGLFRLILGTQRAFGRRHCADLALAEWDLGGLAFLADAGHAFGIRTETLLGPGGSGPALCMTDFV